MPKHELSAEQYREAAAGLMLEADWQATVLEMANVHGWVTLLNIPDQAYMELVNALMPFNPVTKKRVARSRTALATLHAIKAWPDLFIGNPTMGRAIALELKTQKGKVDPAQREKVKLLNDCGVTAGIWRPRQHDELDALLASGW